MNNKLIAKREFRHGAQRLRVGDKFEASPLDTEYYMQYGYAEAQEGAQIQPAQRRAYGRKDMQAEEMSTTALTPDAQNEAKARGLARAQQNPQSRAREPQARANRVTAPMSTANATGAVAPANPDAAAVPAVPAGTVVSTPENPAPVVQPAVPTAPVPAPVQAPAAPQPAPNVASGGGTTAAPTVSAATGSAAGQASTNG